MTEVSQGTQQICNCTVRDYNANICKIFASLQRFAKISKVRRRTQQICNCTVRDYKYYIPLKRCGILSMQNFRCRKFDFRVLKINAKNCINFRTTKIDFSAKQKFCNFFHILKTQLRFHFIDTRPGRALQCLHDFHFRINRKFDQCRAKTDHSGRLFFSTPTFLRHQILKNFGC